MYINYKGSLKGSTVMLLMGSVDVSKTIMIG
jgi:hypothetical protein